MACDHMIITHRERVVRRRTYVVRKLPLEDFVGLGITRDNEGGKLKE